MINRTAQILKALGEPTRLRIVRLLKERELCICELVAVLDMSQPRVSQHVKILKQAGIVRERKDRQRSFFRLEDDLAGGRVSSLERLFGTGLENIADLSGEMERLENIDQDPQVVQCKQMPARALV